jgi:transposase
MKTTIGVDLHKCTMTCVVLDESGAVIGCKELATKCRKQVGEYFGSFGPHCQVAVESVGFYQWFWDLVRPRVGRLCLTYPAGVRAFAGHKTKTDRNDALLLAILPWEDRLPMAYVPNEPVRALRDLVRHRMSVTRSARVERRQSRWISLKNTPWSASFTSARA